MGLRDEITASVRAAFDTDLADAASAFICRRVWALGPVDPISQMQSTQTTHYWGRGVFGRFASHVVDGLRILHTDIKLTVLQYDLAVMPEVGDTIVRTYDYTEYTVVGVAQDAAGVTWTLQLRGQ